MKDISGIMIKYAAASNGLKINRGTRRGLNPILRNFPHQLFFAPSAIHARISSISSCGSGGLPKGIRGCISPSTLSTRALLSGSPGLIILSDAAAFA